MLDKVKQWFGIEGVKVELIIPEAVSLKNGVIKGQLQFSSMNAQTVQNINLKLVEIYTRGRRKNKMTNEYEIGQVTIFESFQVPAELPILVDFELPFELLKSEVDEMADKNFLLGGVAKLAKLSRGVNSEFRVEVEADVKGTRLNPFDKKTILLK
ncbi:MAG: sporulation protein [Saprospiraceae bacterium]